MAFVRTPLIGRAPICPQNPAALPTIGRQLRELICARDGTSRMIMMTVPCGFAFARSPEVSPLPGIEVVRSRIGTGIRIRPSAPSSRRNVSSTIDQCQGSPIVPTEVKDSTSVPGVWFRSIYVPQVHCGTGHFPRGPLNTIRRTP